MAKKMTKREISAFMGAASKMLVALGGVPTENAVDPKNQLTLNTIAGPLRCHVYDNWIAMQFDDEKKAVELIHFGNLNPYSGKWNWMYNHPEPSDLSPLMFDLLGITSSDLEKAGNSIISPRQGDDTFANLKLAYTYRDGDGCSASKEVVMRGLFRQQSVNAFLTTCENSTGMLRFIPGVVGLPDLQDQLQSKMWSPAHAHADAKLTPSAAAEDEPLESGIWNPARTQPWHEITSLMATDEEPNVEGEAEYLADFARTMCNVFLTTGWPSDYKPPYYGEMIQAYAESIAKGPLNWSPSGGSAAILAPLSPTGDQSIEALVRKTPFVLGYVVAALWTEQDNLSEGSAIQNVSDVSLRKAYNDCEAFVAANVEFLDAAYGIYPSSGDGSSPPEQAGHDFWLTRNGHGAGYWDRGLGHIGDKLAEAANATGVCDLVEGDDGKLYFEGGDVVKAAPKAGSLPSEASRAAGAVPGPGSGSDLPAP